MNNSEFLKVKFLYGNNERYDYYILAERQEIEISENELVFKVSNLSKTNIVSFNGIYGNFDFLLQKTSKNTNIFLGYELVNSEELEYE